MKQFYILIAILFSSFSIQAQYEESFITANKGILFGPCGTNNINSCASFDLGGENYWTLGGDLSGIDTEGLKTVGGALQYADVDVLACFISPPIDISSVATSTVTAEIVLSGGWDATDYGYVSYIVDGAPQVIIPNVHGCPDVNTFGLGCPIPNGTYTPTATGIVGDEITVMVCMDANAQAEIANVNSVSVPEVGSVVPVTWNKFTAKTMEDGNLLEWSTASELNNDRFEIERSVNNTADFRMISSKNGVGTTSEETFYSFLDENVTPGSIYYYRIKQVDYDGNKSFSRLLSLQTANHADFVVRPNPFSEQFVINFTTDNNVHTPKVYNLYNAQGIMMKEIDGNEGRNIVVDVSDLAPGIYYLSGDNNTVKKIVKSY